MFDVSLDDINWIVEIAPMGTTSASHPIEAGRGMLGQLDYLHWEGFEPVAVLLLVGDSAVSFEIDRWAIELAANSPKVALTMQASKIIVAGETLGATVDEAISLAFPQAKKFAA